MKTIQKKDLLVEHPSGSIAASLAKTPDYKVLLDFSDHGVCTRHGASKASTTTMHIQLSKFVENG